MWFLNKILETIGFTGFFLRKLVEANLFIAKDLLTPGLLVHPAFISIPLQLDKNYQLLLLSNLVSMTPGTLVVDIEIESRELLIHSMYASDPESVQSEIDEFQKRIKKLFE